MDIPAIAPSLTAMLCVLGQTYCFSHLNNTTVKMIEEFKRVEPEPGWIKEDHVRNDEAMIDFLLNSIISSIYSTTAVSCFDPNVPRFIASASSPCIVLQKPPSA